MRRLLVLAGVVLLFAACAAPPAATPAVSEPDPTPTASTPETVEEPTWLDKQIEALLPDGHTLGEAVQVGDMKILPLLNPQAPRETSYMTLHEAMEADLCIVREQNDVNEVLVTNRARMPLFLMVGDLVLGGDQDRVMAESVVIEPNAEDARVPVFCVEPHRWSVEKGNEKSENGEFYARKDARQADLKVKGAALATSDQSEVWDAVKKVNTALKVEDAEGSFRMAYDDDVTSEKLTELYTAAKTAKVPHTVGFMVVRGDDVIAMDLFDSKELFTKLADNLLRSYLVTAVSAQARAGGGSGPSIEYVEEEDEPDEITLATYEDWLRTNQRRDSLESSRSTPMSDEERAVRTALEESRTEVYFKDTALDDVIAWMRSQFRINIVRSRDVDGDITVSLDFGRIKLRQALELVCDECELEWTVRDAAVVISTPGSNAEQTSNVNTETETTRRTNELAVQYTCKDTKRNSAVHRSFMRR